MFILSEHICQRKSHNWEINKRHVTNFLAFQHFQHKESYSNKEAYIRFKSKQLVKDKMKSEFHSETKYMQSEFCY